jgi:hypothetical protein
MAEKSPTTIPIRIPGIPLNSKEKRPTYPPRKIIISELISKNNPTINISDIIP